MWKRVEVTAAVTPYDMYLIFREALKYDLVNEIIRMTSYETVYTDKSGNSKQLSFTTTNWNLNGNQKAPEQVSVMGGKTVTTNAAGNCLILLARDTAGNPYIAIVMRAVEREVMYGEMSDLLDEIH